MQRYLFLTLLALIVAATILWEWRRSGRLFCRPMPRRFWNRQSQEAVWKQTCKNEQLDKADALLRTLCEAFSFNPDDRYHFAPTDRISDVYQAFYPRWRFWQMADCMEVESLMMDLQRRFQLNDAEVSEMTLAEVVELINSREEI
jgi:hypothetical protein